MNAWRHVVNAHGRASSLFDVQFLLFPLAILSTHHIVAVRAVTERSDTAQVYPLYHVTTFRLPLICKSGIKVAAMTTTAALRALGTTELLEQILIHVHDTRELFKVQRVNRHFRDTVEGSVTLLRIMSILPREPSGVIIAPRTFKMGDWLHPFLLNRRGILFYSPVWSLNEWGVDLYQKGSRETVVHPIDFTNPAPIYAMRSGEACTDSVKVRFVRRGYVCDEEDDEEADADAVADAYKTRVWHPRTGASWTYGSWRRMLAALEPARLPITVSVPDNFRGCLSSGEAQLEVTNMTLGDLADFLDESALRVERGRIKAEESEPTRGC